MADIPITGILGPSAGAGAFKIVRFTDIATGTVDVVVTLIAGGRITAGGTDGEIVVQTGAGTPSHSASEGTLYWDTTNNLLYANNNGTTGWTQVSGAGGSAVYEHRWAANGDYIVATSVDGAYIADAAFTITGIWLWQGTGGSSGSTVLDLNKNGTTMYTTQGNRPTIAFNDGDGKVDCTLPDVVSVAAGDILTIDIDSVQAGAPKDIILIIQGS